VVHKQQSAGILRRLREHGLACIHRGAHARDASAVFDLEAVVRAGIIADGGVVQQFVEVACDFG